jgi:hypothetical protein
VLSQGPGLARNEAEASVASRSAVERQSRPKPCRPPRIRTPMSWPDPSGVATPQNTNCASCAKRRRRCRHPRRHRRASPSRRSVLLAAGELATKTSSGDSGGLDSAETRAQVQAPSPGRRNGKAAAQECAPQRRAAQGPHIIDVQKEAAAFRTVALSRKDFFPWYNEEHYHSVLALLTPAMVHYQQTGPILQQRQQVRDVVYQLPRERFVRQAPKQPAVPTEVWINNPLNLEIRRFRLFSGRRSQI